MKKIKSGLALIALGVAMFICYVLFMGGDASDLQNFFHGLVFGLAAGVSLLGVVLSALGVKEIESKKSE